MLSNCNSTRRLLWLSAVIALAIGLVASTAQAQSPLVSRRHSSAADSADYGFQAHLPMPGTAAVEFRPPLWHYLQWPEHLRHHDPNDPQRHVGLGYPLIGTSWRNRPWHVGWLVGGLMGDEPIRGRVGQDTGLLGGYRVGWDFDHYFGSEVRFAFANLDLTNPVNSEKRGHTSRDHFWDVSLTYYPWGDSRWRPYGTVGLGLASFYFRDDQRQVVRETALSLPIGVGVKYYVDNWWAVRVSLMDNLSLGTQGISKMHNVSLTTGVEVRWGGRRR